MSSSGRALGAAAVAAAAWSLPALAVPLPPLAARLGARTRLPDGDGSGAPVVALTFDDGPHPEGTPLVLEQLAAAGAKATFFLVGEQVEQRPALAAEIAAAGHEIALHGYRHRLLLRIPARVLADDLARAIDVIAGATGRTPVVYRPPYGICSWPGLALARRRGWPVLLWSHHGRDWARTATPRSIHRRLTGRLDAGAVLLLHDSDAYSAPGSWRRTTAALPRVLDSIAAAGFATAGVERALDV